MQTGTLFQTLPLYNAIINSKERTCVCQGGTASGKTYSIMQVLFTLAMEEARQVITVVGQDIPNLKVGAYRDAKTIHDSSSVLQGWFPTINEGERIIKCANGSIIEFKSYADEQDAKNGKRDYLFVNEANGISYEVFWQLDMRTRKKVRTVNTPDKMCCHRLFNLNFSKYSTSNLRNMEIIIILSEVVILEIIIIFR